MRQGQLVFLDLETTGLNPGKHAILEVAAIITDDTLAEIARMTRVVYWCSSRWMIHPSGATRDDWAKDQGVDPVVVEMHTKNGLWRDSAERGLPLQHVDLQLSEFIKQHCSAVGEKSGPQLAGNTISFDRAFLRAQMPATHEFLHYRNVDVTTLNELARRFWPAIHAGRPKAFESAHRAEADCVESLETARYYACSLAPVVVML